MTKNELSLLVASSCVIRVCATMCVVGLINGKLAAACYTCASRAGWTGVPLEKCHMFGTSYPVVITVRVWNSHMFTVPILQGIVTHKSARLKVDTHMFWG